jgi:hypothetical protein
LSNGTKMPQNNMLHLGTGGTNEAGGSFLWELSVIVLGIFMTVEKVLANTADIANVGTVHLYNDTCGLSICRYSHNYPFKRPVKSHLPFDSIIRSSPYSPC